MAAPDTAPYQGAKLIFVKSNACFPRYAVGGHEPDIVSGQAVCRAWISEACNELHRKHAML